MMNQGSIEEHRPRAVADLGDWRIEPLSLKVYSIVADGQLLTKAATQTARSFVSHQVPPLVSAEGQDNGLGFVIVHPGALGLSVLAHWWVQGSVLCQHIHRQLWTATEPIETASRPVIACVWELALINAEQDIWRKTMMSNAPDPAAYLTTRAALATV